MGRSWKIFGYLCALAFLASCSRDMGNDSKLTIELPVLSASTIHQSVSGQNVNGGPDWNDNLDPTSIGQINCYGVFVGGPGLNQNRCGRSDTQEVKFEFGPSRFFIPAGSTIELDVPSGPAREIVLVGLRAQNGACFGMDPNSDQEPDFQNMSFPHILSRQVVNLQPGDQTVQMVATLNTADKFNDCDFIDGGPGGGNEIPLFNPDFGTGTETKNVTATGTVLDGTTGQFCDAASECGAFGRVDAVFDYGPSFDLTMAGGTETDFAPGDEVIAIIMDARGPGGPDGFCGGGPGEAHIGGFSEHTITSITGNVIRLGEDSQMLGAVSSRPSSNLTVDPGGPTGDFCYLQLVKVVHLQNLTIGNGVELSAPGFDSTSHNGGGVVALRIAGTLTFGDAASRISASGAGHPGDLGGDGRGHGGQSGTTAGRKSASAVKGGGGGGHSSPTPQGPPSGGDGGGEPGSGGGGVNDQCGAFGPSCSQFGKPILGGSGGGVDGTSLPGGKGAGLVFIEAQTVQVTTSGKIEASGENGIDGVTTGEAGSGGGAGGWIRFFVGDVLGGYVELQANGGDGGDGNSDNGGGGGSAGFIGMATCPHNRHSIDLDNDGGGGGPGTVSGGFGESGGQLRGGFGNSVTCPGALFIDLSGEDESDEVDFGNQPLSTVVERTLVIENVGQTSATNITGTVPTSQFSFKGGGFPGTGGTCTSGGSLAPGNSCTIVLQYSSQAATSEDSGSLTINYNNSTARSFTISLEGDTTVAELEFENEIFELDFGDVTQSTTTAVTLTIENVGLNPANSMSGSSLPQEFDFKGGGYPGTGGTCSGGPLAAGTSCTVVLEFAPTVVGEQYDFLQINYNNGAGAESLDLHLKGNGISP